MLKSQSPPHHQKRQTRITSSTTKTKSCIKPQQTPNHSTTLQKPHKLSRRHSTRKMSSSTPNTTPSSGNLHNKPRHGIHSEEILDNTFIFMDLDGTLLPPKSPTIPLKVSQTLSSLQPHGVKRVLITGRGYESTVRIVKDSHKLLFDCLNDIDQQGNDKNGKNDKNSQNNQNNQNNQNKNNNSTKPLPTIFDYVITSSGAAISDHTYDIIDKRSIPIEVATKSIEFLHQNNMSYFVQHPIPNNSKHHQHTFPHLLGIENDCYVGNEKGNGNGSNNIAYKSPLTVNSFIPLVISSTDYIVNLPDNFCVEQYNQSLPNDHLDRIKFHQKDGNSIPLSFPNNPSNLSCPDKPTQSNVVHNTNNSAVFGSYHETLGSVREQIGHEISQLIVSLHRGTLLKIVHSDQQSNFVNRYTLPSEGFNTYVSLHDLIQYENHISTNTSDDILVPPLKPQVPTLDGTTQLSPPSGEFGLTKPNLTQKSTPLCPLSPFPIPSQSAQSTKFRLKSNCNCCSGEYMMYTDPMELVSHLSHNLFQFLNLQNNLVDISTPPGDIPLRLSSDSSDLDVSLDGTMAKIVKGDGNNSNVLRRVLDYTQELTPVHCTSPFDHKSVWYELLPPLVNKNHAAETIIRNVYENKKSNLESKKESKSHLSDSDFLPDSVIDNSTKSANNHLLPLALFSFGNDFNDLPMLKFVKEEQQLVGGANGVESTPSVIMNGSYLIQTKNQILKQLCDQNGFEMIGTCEDGAVGEKIEEIIQKIRDKCCNDPIQ
jgi:hydroxymethylpyrimidine pyrophosphatase-like HAD family hydrolase